MSRLVLVSIIEVLISCLLTSGPSAVEIDLRQPSMLHGKKGFERVVWAFKNVLTHSLTWLFHDFEKKTDSMTYSDEDGSGVTDLSAAAGESPVAKYHPTEKICSPQQRTTKAAKVPNLTSTKSSSCADDFEDWAVETHEWLNLLAMNSPRVFLEDSIDPFLSRYQVPEGDSKNAHSMVIVTWNGLIPASWIRQLLLETR